MLRNLQQTDQMITINDISSAKLRLVHEAAKRKEKFPNLQTNYLMPRALSVKGLAMSCSPSRRAGDTSVQDFVAHECEDTRKRGLEGFLGSDFWHRKLLQ